MTSRVWFTADTHFGHANILKYSARPFKTIEEMDDALIHEWNARVGHGDLVYHLGDFSFQDAAHYLPRLNGQKFLIAGNHDKEKTRRRIEWVQVSDYKEIKVEGQKIVLCHYGFATWNGSHKESWSLHGHSHGSLPAVGKRADVGVDCWGYAPVSFERLSELMAGRDFVATDYHGGPLA